MDSSRCSVLQFFLILLRQSSFFATSSASSPPWFGGLDLGCDGEEEGAKARKCDVQCKNRIDTLKKKCEVEKAKSAPSTWPFFGRLDYLIGPATVGKKACSPASNFTPKQPPSRFRSNSTPNPNPNSSGDPISKPRSGALAVLSGESSSRLNSVDSSDSRSSFCCKGPANMLMEAQLEIEKVKRSKNASNSGKLSRTSRKVVPVPFSVLPEFNLGIL